MFTSFEVLPPSVPQQAIASAAVKALNKLAFKQNARHNPFHPGRFEGLEDGQGNILGYSPLVPMVAAQLFWSAPFEGFYFDASGYKNAGEDTWHPDPIEGWSQRQLSHIFLFNTPQRRWDSFKLLPLPRNPNDPNPRPPDSWTLDGRYSLHYPRSFHGPSHELLAMGQIKMGVSFPHWVTHLSTPPISANTLAHARIEWNSMFPLLVLVKDAITHLAERWMDYRLPDNFFLSGPNLGSVMFKFRLRVGVRSTGPVLPPQHYPYTSVLTEPVVVTMNHIRAYRSFPVVYGLILQLLRLMARAINQLNPNYHSSDDLKEILSYRLYYSFYKFNPLVANPEGSYLHIDLRYGADYLQTLNRIILRRQNRPLVARRRRRLREEEEEEERDETSSSTDPPPRRVRLIPPPTRVRLIPPPTRVRLIPPPTRIRLIPPPEPAPPPSPPPAPEPDPELVEPNPIPTLTITHSNQDVAMYRAMQPFYALMYLMQISFTRLLQWNRRIVRPEHNPLVQELLFSVGADLVPHFGVSRDGSYGHMQEIEAAFSRLMATMRPLRFRGGGCFIRRASGAMRVTRRDLLPHSLRREGSFFPLVISDGNNCFLECLIMKFHDTVFKEFNCDQREITYELMRKQCGLLPSGSVVRLDQIEGVVARFHIHINIYALAKYPPPDGIGAGFIALESTFGEPTWPSINLLLHAGHYNYVAKEQGLNYRYCPSCYKWMPHTPSRGKETPSTFEKHFNRCARCPKCNQPVADRAHHKCHGFRVASNQGRVNLKHSQKDPEFTAMTNVWFADFETSTFSLGSIHRVYACGLASNINDPNQVQIFYGLDSMRQFIDAITGLSGTMVFFNGSGFDFFFIIEHLLHYKPELFREITDVVIKGRKFYTFTFGALKFIDLFLFLHCSLAAACKSLKVPQDYCKGKFDHSKMDEVEKLATYKTEVCEYLRLDVLALGHCWRIFAEGCWKDFGQNLDRYMTLSHMAFNKWTAALKPEEDIVVGSRAEDAYFRQAYFGGRCCPQFTHFETKNVRPTPDEGGEVSEEDWLKLNDYLIDLDVVSLYPTNMQKHDYPYGRFVIHKVYGPNVYPESQARHWQRLIKENDPKIWFAEVDIDPPDDIITPFLLERHKDGSVIYSLLPKRHAVYTACEIREALLIGYTVKAIYSYVTFHSRGPIFRSYVDECFAVKKAAEKGSVTYQAAKLYMNALSGKMGQRPISDEWTYVTNSVELGEIMSKKNVTDFQYIMFNEPGIIDASEGESSNLSKRPSAIAVKSEIAYPKPTKPVQLGCLILGQSRVWMSRIFRTVNAYRDPNHAFFYTDTDSMHVRSATRDLMMKSSNLLGKDLGQLSDELDGGKIVRAIYLAPKTYILEYISATKPHRYYWRVRCKGVPHVECDLDVVKVLKGEWENPSGLSYALYSENGREDQEEPLATAPCITFDFFEQMLNKNCRTVLRMSSLRRLMAGTSPTQREMGILACTLERTVNHTLWWKQGKRFFPPKSEDMPGFSLPLGHRASFSPLSVKQETVTAPALTWSEVTVDERQGAPPLDLAAYVEREQNGELINNDESEAFETLYKLLFENGGDEADLSMRDDVNFLM